MSTASRRVVARTIPMLVILMLVFASSALAQGFTPPVVTVQATDSSASKAGDPGAFTIYRTGNLTNSLTVFYQVFGSAVPGIDYFGLGQLVTLAPGAASAALSVVPIANSPLVSTQTVLLQIVPSPFAGPFPSYDVGYPSNATVYIDGPAPKNQPPSVAVVGPFDGSVFVSPSNILITASAFDRDGFVASVQFFAGTNRLGTVPGATNGPTANSLYSIQWTNPPTGGYALTAVATDNQGAAATSAPVNITVSAPVVFPLVTIAASAPAAAQPCGTNSAVSAKFTVARDSHTNVDFVVWYAIGGTAVNGVDYARISNAVVIPIGAWSADVTINPLAARVFAATETVELDLLPPICPSLWPPPPDCFHLGTPASATVFIKVCLPGTNLPPMVRLISPPNHATFRSPVNLPIYAYANDSDGSVTSVEFSAGTNSLGFGQTIVLTNRTPPIPLPTPISSNLFVLVWTNPPVGTYALTARATDNGGASTVSAPVDISVLGPPPPPPTNRPTVVSVVATDPIAIEGTNCWVWTGLTNVTVSWTNWPGGSVTRSFTNCGPKNATFTISRFGSTNDALTVSYSVSGTASNGVDYATLPGTATIPAGARSALVPVIPIDDGPPDTNSTVVLHLTASTNYLVGLPEKAAALIVDGKWIPPRIGGGTVPFLLADKCFHLNAAGPDGAWFQVLYSTNALNWVPICTNQVINGSVDFIDPDASTSQWRFYRTVPQFSAPQ